MDSSPAPESTLLQRRLQERKRSSNLPPLDTSMPRRPIAGRDDAIFDSADDPSSRRSSARLFQSSPVNTSLQNTSQSRRTSHMSTPTAASGHTMGVREIQGHVDKLSKQNFDLKLELHHRREKTEELERKLQQLPQLRADNEELAELNKDLMVELDKRDRAVDEAVVMICDFEAKVRELQSQLDDMRPKTARQHPRSPSMSRSASYQQISTPSKQRRRTNSVDAVERPSRTAVSPSVSLKMAELATPRGSKEPARPSFFDQTTSDTRALRSLYIHGDKRIRALPSRESLLSENDAAEAGLRSPAMSMLSESEFRSLYGDRNPSPEKSQNYTELALEPETPIQVSPQSERTRLARTNKWVNERVHSPALHRPRPMRQSTSPQFQSLGGLMQGERAPGHSGSSKPTRRVQDDIAISETFQNPVFGRNNFPPTPDTMLTQPSTHSSASIINEKGSADIGIEHVKPLANTLPVSLAGDLHTPSAEFFSSRSMLSREHNAYGSDSEGEPSPPHPAPSFGRSLFQSDGNASDGPTQNIRPNAHDNPFMPSNLFEMHQAQAASKSRSTASSPQGLGSIPLQTLNHITFDKAPPPPIHKRSTSATPTQSTLNRRPHSDYEPLPPGFDLADLSPLRDAPPPPPHREGSYLDLSRTVKPRPATPKTAVSAEFAEGQTVSAPSRADQIRQRVSKFGRRNSANQETAPRPASQTTPRHGRDGSFGRRTKQFFRRNSNTQPNSTSPRSSKSPSRVRRGTSTFTVDGADGESDPGHAAAFLSAAQAAAPYLDLLGNQRKEPLKGISTSIPMAPPISSISKEGRSSSASTPIAHISVADSAIRARQASGTRLFPRRGKDGQDLSEQQ